MRKDIVVIDLDGTLCNDAHRSHLASAGQWDEYHSLCKDDVPHADVVSFLRMCEDETILAITGRNERFRQATYDWLGKHQLGAYIDAVLMRGDDDYRPITEVKLRALEEYLAEGITFEPDALKSLVIARVLVCLDDRDKMVEAYREYGLPCWQVRPGGQ